MAGIATRALRGRSHTTAANHSTGIAGQTVPVVAVSAQTLVVAEVAVGVACGAVGRKEGALETVGIAGRAGQAGLVVARVAGAAADGGNGASREAGQAVG